MDIQTFIDNYQETFSGKAELPIAFWYSDTLSGELRKTQGCLFKAEKASVAEVGNSIPDSLPCRNMYLTLFP